MQRQGLAIQQRGADLDEGRAIREMLGPDGEVDDEKAAFLTKVFGAGAVTTPEPTLESTPWMADAAGGMTQGPVSAPVQGAVRITTRPGEQADLDYRAGQTQLQQGQLAQMTAQQQAAALIASPAFKSLPYDQRDQLSRAAGQGGVERNDAEAIAIEQRQNAQRMRELNVMNPPDRYGAGRTGAKLDPHEAQWQLAYATHLRGLNAGVVTMVNQSQGQLTPEDMQQMYVDAAQQAEVMTTSQLGPRPQPKNPGALPETPVNPAADYDLEIEKILATGVTPEALYNSLRTDPEIRREFEQNGYSLVDVAETLQRRMTPSPPGPMMGPAAPSAGQRLSDWLRAPEAPAQPTLPALTGTGVGGAGVQSQIQQNIARMLQRQ